MARARKPCSRSTRGCPRLAAPGKSRCPECEHEADQARGSSHSRGYGGAKWRARRKATLLRDPVCTVCHLAPSTVADHYPESRRELVARGVADPDALEHLRGVCRPCHSTETTRHQPGGWNDATST